MNRSERRAAAQAQRPQVQVAQPPGLHQRAFKEHHMPNKPKIADLYDVASLSISNDPFVGRKRKEGSKYDAIFSQLKIGQRLVCHSDAAARLASQLKQWLVKRGHKNPVVRAVSHYGDGKGGVWWMEVDAATKGRAKPQTTWVDVAARKAA